MISLNNIHSMYILQLRKKLFSIRKAEILEYFKNPYRLSIILLIFAVFGYQTLIINEDLGILGSIEIDPRANIESILGLLKSPYYNMNAHYTSSLYGWAYFAINFWILFIPKLILNVENTEVLFFLIKFILLIIGIACTVTLFDLTKMLSNSSKFAFIMSLYCISINYINKWFFFIHSDSTGLLFLLLGSTCLHKYSIQSDRNLHLFWSGITYLVLSALSKHAFLFISLPLYVGFLIELSKKEGTSRKLNKILEILIKSFVISLVIFFLVHPFAFIQPLHFFDIQFGQLKTNGGWLAKSQSMSIWWERIQSDLIIMFNLFILGPLIIASTFFQSFRKRIPAFFYYSVLGSIFFVLMIVVSESMWMTLNYMYPVYPFFVINIGFSILYFFRLLKTFRVYKIFRYSLFLIISYPVTITMLSNMLDTINGLYSRSLYKQTSRYQTFSFINQLPHDSKIAWDNSVAMPFSREGNNTCFYWSNCASLESIIKFNPDYVMFYEEYGYNGKYTKNTQDLRDYVKMYNYKKIKMIEPHDIPLWIEKLPYPCVLEEKDLLKVSDPVMEKRFKIQSILLLDRFVEGIKILKALYYVKQNAITVGTPISIYQR